MVLCPQSTYFNDVLAPGGPFAGVFTLKLDPDDGMEALGRC